MKSLSAPRQPFVGLSIVAAIGIICADFFPLPGFVGLIAAIVLIAALVLLRWPQLTSTYALVCAGFFLLHSFQITDTPGLRLATRLGPRSRAIAATGSVVSEPKIGPNGFATFLLRLEAIELEGKNESTHATMLVRWRGNPEFGDELKLFGIAEAIAPPRNPGEFDMRSYLARRDVRRSLFVRYLEEGLLVRHGGGHPILRAAQKSRAWMQSTLCRSLDDAPEVQTFISGIALGLRHQTPEDIEEPFQQTGTLHLFAVAGLHVGIVASLLWILASVAQFSRKWATGLIIPLVLFYAAVTGLHVSSVRAAVMSSILLGGFFFERKVFALNSLAAAAFIILCWNTNEVFSIGFQLSFAVVGAIILLADPLFGFLRRWSAPDSFLPRVLLHGPRRLLHVCFEWMGRGASVSLAAWIGSLPLILWYFYLVTPVSLFANLLVVPIAFFILAIALLSLLSAPLFPSVSVIFNNANWCLARLVLGLVHLSRRSPADIIMSNIPVRPMMPRPGLLCWMSARARQFICGHEARIGCSIAGVSGITHELFEIISSATGVNRLDGLLLTHGDSLHIGGAAPLLRDFSLMRLIDNSAPDRSIVHQRLHRAFQDRGMTPDSLAAGESFRLSGTVTAHVLYPPRIFPAATTDDQAYAIQLFVAPSTQVLFMSDSGFATERALLASGLNLRSDILVKGQHHSGSSGSDKFLEAVRPRLIIATSRDFPEYERVSDEWAEQVRASGIKLFRQDETGAVELKFGRNDWEARAYITGEAFRSANR